MKKNKIKVLIFDVFGTVVDWRSSIVNGLKELLPIDMKDDELESFAIEWRKGYTEFISDFNKGLNDWMNVDDIHLKKLTEILESKNILNLLDKNQISEINLLWHKLNPWKDTVEGLKLLKTNYSIGTLSNGNFSLLLNMSKHSNLMWDFIFSGDIFLAYKPNKFVYKHACKLLDLNPNEVALVAAHENDLIAASKVGLKTAYVDRPLEYSNNISNKDIKKFDINAKNFIDLYEKLQLSTD
jgi:2-haloacid dehalogenase|tara:strand:+ start:329 stop:1048 length:720 start_codon:yes stop_codon:yes gene_type:complete